MATPLFFAPGEAALYWTGPAGGAVKKRIYTLDGVWITIPEEFERVTGDERTGKGTVETLDVSNGCSLKFKFYYAVVESTGVDDTDVTVEEMSPYLVLNDTASEASGYSEVGGGGRGSDRAGTWEITPLDDEVPDTVLAHTWHVPAGVPMLNGTWQYSKAGQPDQFIDVEVVALPSDITIGAVTKSVYYHYGANPGA